MWYFFTLYFYCFLFSRYLDLTKCQFSSDILFLFPDASILYSHEYCPEICHFNCIPPAKYQKNMRKTCFFAFSLNVGPSLAHVFTHYPQWNISGNSIYTKKLCYNAVFLNKRDVFKIALLGFCRAKNRTSMWQTQNQIRFFFWNNKKEIVFKKRCSMFLNWDSLHGRLSSHYKAWNYKKKKYKKIKVNRKSV